MKTSDQITIDLHLEMIKDERYSAEGREDARRYIEYLKEFGTDSQKAYIRKQTEVQQDYYHGVTL